MKRSDAPQAADVSPSDVSHDRFVRDASRFDASTLDGSSTDASGLDGMADSSRTDAGATDSARALPAVARFKRTGRTPKPTPLRHRGQRGLGVLGHAELTPITGTCSPTGRADPIELMSSMQAIFHTDAVGNSSHAFAKVKYQVECKVRRLAAKKSKRKGFGWKRWSREIVYGSWGLFRDYRIAYSSAKARAGRTDS